MPLRIGKKTIEINLSGGLLWDKYQIPEMIKSGSGSIINMFSIVGQVTNIRMAGDEASKHEVIGLT